MMPGTVTRAQLSEAVYQEVGLSRNESAELVENVLDEIVESLVRGDTVKISSFDGRVSQRLTKLVIPVDKESSFRVAALAAFE